MLNITNIPAPRVEFVDPRTGLVSREWYRFLSNLFYLTGSGSSADTIPEVADAVNTLAQSPNDVLLSQVAELQKQLDAINSTPSAAIEGLAPQIAEIQKEIDALKMQVQPQLGTMAALQQANLPWVTFDTTPQSVPTGAAAAGTLYWDTADNTKTLNLIMEDAGGVIQKIGEETYYRVKASSTITKGQVVMFDGTLGASGGLKAKPATGLTATQSEYVMGVATQNIATNGWGYITWFGEVRDVNTTGSLYSETWADGDILYYNPAFAGGLTKTIPTAPNPKVIVASVIHAATNGILFVRPTFGSALGATDSNVQITSLTNGDLLQYVSANSRWENKPATALGGAPITKTADFTVTDGQTWFFVNKSGSTCVVTLPSASSYTGRVLTFHNMEPQLLNSASGNVCPAGSDIAGTAILPATDGAWATMVSDGSNWRIIQYGP